MIAFRMKQLGSALERLDPETRALLDLSMRRDMPDEEIAGVLDVPVEEVGRRRSAGLDRLADDLKLDGREQREELFAALPDLPASYWGDRSARA